MNAAEPRRHVSPAAGEALTPAKPSKTRERKTHSAYDSAVSGPSRESDPPAPHELYALYTRQAWWGTGLGDALLEAAVPPGPGWLFVLEANERAQGFYRRHGFAPDGFRQLYAGLVLRMLRKGH